MPAEQTHTVKVSRADQKHLIGSNAKNPLLLHYVDNVCHLAYIFMLLISVAGGRHQGNSRRNIV